MSQPHDESGLRRAVAAWLAEGVPVPEIERRLAERGLARDTAAKLVDASLSRRVGDVVTAAVRRDRRNLLLGIGLCALGLGLLVGPILVIDSETLAQTWHVWLGVGAVAASGGATLVVRALV